MLPVPRRSYVAPARTAEATTCSCCIADYRSRRSSVGVSAASCRFKHPSTTRPLRTLSSPCIAYEMPNRLRIAGLRPVRGSFRSRTTVRRLPVKVCCRPAAVIGRRSFRVCFRESPPESDQIIQATSRRVAVTVHRLNRRHHYGIRDCRRALATRLRARRSRAQPHGRILVVGVNRLGVCPAAA